MFAQTPAVTPPVVTPPVPPAALPNKPVLSPTAMTKGAAEDLAKMQAVLKNVVRLQGVARSQKDVIRLNCVNDKLLQVKQLLNIGDIAYNNLQEAITRGDDETRAHEFDRISISEQQVDGLGTEAANCVGGGDLVYLGNTKVLVDAPEEPDDPTKPPDVGVPPVDPPPLASPFI